MNPVLHKSIPSQNRREIRLLLLCAGRSLERETVEQIKLLSNEDIDWHYLVKMASLHKTQFLLYRSLKIACPEAVTQQKKKDNRTITIDPLSPREAFMELVKHPYRLGLNPREKLRGEFQTLGRLVNSLAVRRICFPRDYALLPDVHEAILADLNTGVGGPQ